MSGLFFLIAGVFVGPFPLAKSCLDCGVFESGCFFAGWKVCLMGFGKDLIVQT